MFIVSALAIQHPVFLSLGLGDGDGDGEPGPVVRSGCLQKPDFTGPAPGACQRPCRFAEAEQYLAQRPTLEGKCPGDRRVVDCPNQPDFCENSDACGAQWGQWSDCDASCGGGLSSRTRVLTSDCLTSCFECASDYRSCNTQPCGYDCTLDSDWGSWSSCSSSCYSGDAGFLLPQQSRYRAITQGVSPGNLCTPDQYVQTQTCPGIHQCPVDCALSVWGDWTACNVQCGCGLQTRARTIVTPPNSIGVPCGLLSQVRNCMCDPCPRACEISEWSFGPCMGDCFINDTIKVYPTRRKSRYVITEAIPFQQPSGCATPCQLETTQQCTWLPPCDSTCVLTPWSTWSGSCSGCVAYGSQIPSQSRFRSITKYGNGLCGCTKEERLCDLNWCFDNCTVSDWSQWGNCAPSGPCSHGQGSGTQHRSRTILNPGSQGAVCPGLDDSKPCSYCCPIDCQVTDWAIDVQCGQPNAAGVLVEIPCGPNPGTRRWKRTITPGNSCGAQCPNDTVKLDSCYPKNPCCAVDCQLGEWSFSPCFGCGLLSVQWKSRQITVAPACGGEPCCDLDCAKFRQVRCPTSQVTPCPQTPCIYAPFGDWDNCPASCLAPGGTPNQRCRHGPLIEGPVDTCPSELKDCEECSNDCCPVNCEVSVWGQWGSCSASCGHGLRSRFRTPTTDASCHGAPCPILQEFQSCDGPACPIDCVISDWSAWTLCPSCAIDGAANSSTRYRPILVQPQHGGAACPSDRLQSNPCPNTPCDRDCVAGPWSAWGDCSVLCGDGFELRTRAVAVTPVGQGMACPPLLQTQWCYHSCPHCVYGPPTDLPCPVSCVDPTAPQPRFIRRRTADLVRASDNATITVCPVQDEPVPCVLPCCPQDCVVSSWGPWGDCIDGVKNRTRSVVSQPTCNGALCPTCYLEKDVCTYTPPTNECEYGQACEEGFSSGPQ